MNEELLKKLYEKYGLSQKGTFEQFSQDMQNPTVQRKFYDKYGLSQKGAFEQFQSDLGFGQQQAQVQPQQGTEQDTGLLAPFRHLIKQAQTPADPNVEKPVDAFTGAWQRGTNLSETSDILSFDKGAPDQAQLAELAKLQQANQQNPGSSAYQKFNNAQTTGESLAALVENPLPIIGEIFIESLAGQAGGWENIAGKAALGGASGGVAGSVIPGLGTAAGIGAGAQAGLVTGMAETSVRLEWAGKFLEVLQEAGVDTADPQALQEAFSNDELISKAIELAHRKAWPIGLFDLISGGLAGRIVSKPAKSLLGKIGQGVGEFGVQGALGGGGEAAGQLAAGEDLHPSSIIAEVIGEGATAPVEIAGGAAAYNRNRAEAPEIADAEQDIESTGDELFDGTIDAQYDEIARKMDELTFEPVSDEEIKGLMGTAGIQDTYFPEADEENELADIEYSPEEAGRIQAAGPLPSQAEQELNLGDSEATPAIDAIPEFERQESERAEFESQYTADELAQMSEEDAAPTSVRRAKDRFEAQQKKEKPVEQASPDKGEYIFEKPKETPAERRIRKIEEQASKTVSPTPTEESDKGAYEFGKKEETIEEKIARGPKPEEIRVHTEKGVEDIYGNIIEEKPKRVRTKPQIDHDQKRKDQVVKYQGQLKNIVAEKKPGKKLKRLQILNERTLALPEVNEQVQSEIKKLQDRTSAQTLEKELKDLSTKDRIARIRDRVAPDDTITAQAFDTLANLAEVPAKPTEEHWNQFEKAYGAVSTKGTFSTEVAELKNIYNRVKKDYDKALTPVREEAAALAEAAKQEARTVKGTKDTHLTNIAKAVAQDNPVSIRQALDDYKKWRKTQNLADTTDDKALKAASAEFYQERADKEIKQEAERQAAKERKEREEKAKATKKAATKNIKKQLGLDEDAETNLLDPNEDTASQLPVNVSNVEQVTPTALFERMAKIYRGPGGDVFLSALDKLVGWANTVSRKFYKNGVEIYLVDGLNIAKGISINDLANNRKIIIIDRNEAGHTDSHELIHYLVRAIIASIALDKGIRPGTNRSFNRYGPKDFLTYLAAADEFYGKVEVIYQKVLRDYRDKLTQIGRKFVNNDSLTQEEVNFLTSLSLYLSSRGHTDFEAITNVKQTQALIDNSWDAVAKKMVYGLHDSDEMLAESFSNPFFMLIMSQMESPKQAGTVKSAFRALVEALQDTIISLLKLIPLKKNSYLDLLIDHMGDMERQFLSDQPTTIENAEFGPIVTPNLETRIRENSALYMAMGGTNSPLNPLTPELRKLINYVANSWYKRDDIVSLEGVERELEAINRRTTKNKFGQVEANLIWKKIQKYRQQVQDAKEMQQNAKAYAEANSPEYRTNKAFRRDVDDFADVDMDRLTVAQTKLVSEGILRLVTGGIPRNAAYNIVNKDQAVKKLNRLLEFQGKYGKNPGLFGINLHHVANASTYSTILAKYNTKASQELFNEVFGKLTFARTFTQSETKDFTDKLFNIVNKYNLSHSDLVRTGMYGAIFSTQLPPTDPDYWAEVEVNADRVVQNSKNKIIALNEKVFKGRGSKTDMRNEIKIAQELYNAIRNRRTRDEVNIPMSGLLTRGQQELYKAFRAFTQFHEADMERNTNGVWNADFKKQHNYFPTFALGNAETGNPNQEDELIPSDRANNLWEALQRNPNYGQITGRQAGFTKEKVQPSDYFYDYDVMSIAHKFAPSILFDLYAARELKILNQLLNKVNGNRLKANNQTVKKVFSGPVLNGLNRQIKSIVGGIVMYDEGLTRAFKSLQQLKNNTAVAMLGTTGQFFIQTSSAIPAALLIAPRGFTRALSILTGIERGEHHSALSEALERLKAKGASITIRDVLFERWETIEDVQRKGLRRGLSRWRGNAEQATTWMLRNGDKFAARLVWFSEFFARGGDINNPSEEHILAAERAVGVLQNMSDVAFSAPFLRTNSQAARILLQMLYAFSSFALNAALHTIYSTKHAFTTNNKEARQVMASSLLMAAAYNAVQIYMIRPGYSAVSDMIFDTDDDDEDEKNYTKEEEFLWATSWDLLVGQWAPTLLEGGIKHWGVKPVMKYRAEQEFETFDPYKDLPLYTPRNEAEVLAEAVGPYGDVVAGVPSLGAGLYQAMDKMANGEEFELNEIAINSLRTMLLFERAFPLRGDMQKLLRNYEKRVRAEERAMKKSGGTAPEGVETGTEFEVPEFELPEYEISIPEDPTQLPE